MPAKRLIAIAMHIDQPFANHHQALGGIRRFASEHPHWRCVIDEHPYTSQSRGKGNPSYDGVIGRLNPEIQQKLRRMGVPFVNTMFASQSDKTAGVYIDVKKCGELAADHLMERGFRRMAFLGLLGYRQGEAVGEQFVRCVIEAGYECKFSSFRSGKCEDRDYWVGLKKHVEDFLDHLTPPVGILTSLPWVARLIITLCDERGWHVPQQVAVMCLDHWPWVIELTPQITCVDANHVAIGYEAGALLESIMKGAMSPNKQIFLPPLGIMTRESTDYFSVEDEVVAQALRVISRHLSDHLSVEEIAYQVAVSPRSLQRRFEAALSRPVAEEIRRLRLEKAKRMLGDKGQPIKRIAREAGFKSPITMNAIFHRELGMSPREYRKQLQPRDARD